MKRQTGIALLVLATGVFAGCNGSSGMGSQQADAFTTEVQAVVATSSDMALPESIDMVMSIDADAASPVLVY